MVTTAPPPPSETQKKILFHVARYRLTVVEAVHRIFYPDKSRDAARKSLERLCAAGWLQSERVRSRTFYYLTSKTCSLLGLPATRSDALGAQSLVESFAVLAFCCMHDRTRERLTADDFQTAFAEFADEPGIALAHQHYYYDRHQDNWYLARATVDTGGSVAAIKRKCRSIARHAANTPGLNQILSQKRFMVTVLTAEETKAMALATALESERTNVQYQVVYVPEIGEVI